MAVVCFPKQAVDACPADAESACDCRRAKLFFATEPQDLNSIDRRLATLIDAARLCGIDPLQLAFTAQIGLKFGEYAQMSRNALPAAVPVSTGCSVAFKAMPLALSSWTMS